MDSSTAPHMKFLIAAYNIYSTGSPDNPGENIQLSNERVYMEFYEDVLHHQDLWFNDFFDIRVHMLCLLFAMVGRQPVVRAPASRQFRSYRYSL